jgi:hypothetical protein
VDCNFFVLSYTALLSSRAFFVHYPKRAVNKANDGLKENNERTNQWNRWQRPVCHDTENKVAAAQYAC